MFYPEYHKSNKIAIGRKSFYKTEVTDMRILTEPAVTYLSTTFKLDGIATNLCRTIIEYINDFYKGPKPYDVLLRTLAGIGFTEENLEQMMADGIVEID